METIILYKSDLEKQIDMKEVKTSFGDSPMEPEEIENEDDESEIKYVGPADKFFSEDEDEKQDMKLRKTDVSERDESEFENYTIIKVDKSMIDEIYP